MGGRLHHECDVWFVWKIRDHLIGRGKYLPGYIVDNMEINRLDPIYEEASLNKIICVFYAVWPSITVTIPRI